MKNILISILFLLPMLIFAQELSECGKDDDPNLTRVESDYLIQYIPNSQRSNCDLAGKKVLFSKGPSGGTIGTKTEYFENIRSRAKHDDKISTCVIELTEEEREISGGYDVIVTYWVKFISKKTRQLIVAEAGSA